MFRNIAFIPQFCIQYGICTLSLNNCRCEHWDVNNEMLHGDFFERESGNPDITMDMFRQIHKWDDHPTLFLNDYNVISNCDVAVVI
jgi:GH35 family endo-1,4-beta-xylanase